MEEIKRQIKEIFNTHTWAVKATSADVEILTDRLMEIFDRETTSAFQRGVHAGQLTFDEAEELGLDGTLRS